MIENVLIGYTSESDCNLIINHILLIYKWVAYVCRDKEKQLNLELSYFYAYIKYEWNGNKNKVFKVLVPNHPILHHNTGHQVQWYPQSTIHTGLY